MPDQWHGFHSYIDSMFVFVCDLGRNTRNLIIQIRSFMILQHKKLSEPILFKLKRKSQLIQIKNMKAIISNGKRTQIYASDLQVDKLKAFISENFPRMKETTLSFADRQGNRIPIDDQTDLENLKQVYKGQNFVEIGIKGSWGGHKGQKPEKKQGFKNGKERRLFVLSKACGGQPENYTAFVEENEGLRVGQLIKLYSQQNGIKLQKEKDPKIIKAKILKRVYGGDVNSYIEFEKNHPELNVGELIREYAKENNLEVPENNEKRTQKKKQKLSQYLNRPESQFNELIENHPKLNFKQLLELLAAKQGFQINQEKFKMVRRHHREQKSGHKAYKGEKKSHSKKKMMKEKIMDNKEEMMKPESKQEQMRSKGKTLIKMKELFGAERGKEYFDFISQNFALGQEGIIQKWIEIQTKQ